MADFVDFASGGEGVMGECQDDSDSSPIDDPVVAKYRSMSRDAVNAELRNAGIDPQPTIDAVKQLIREKLTGRAAGARDRSVRRPSKA
jgi:hypothetical protein